MNSEEDYIIKVESYFLVDDYFSNTGDEMAEDEQNYNDLLYEYYENNYINCIN